MGSLEDYILTPPSAKTLEIIYSVIAVGEGCGAEPGLVELCRRCLSADPGRKPLMRMGTAAVSSMSSCDRRSVGESLSRRWCAPW